MTQKTLSAFRSDGRGLFRFRDSYLLSQSKDFCVKRCAAKDDFAEDGDEHVDDLVHAGKGIRWGMQNSKVSTADEINGRDSGEIDRL